MRLLHAGTDHGGRGTAARQPRPDRWTRSGIGVSGNLCRCGAYPNIFKAAERAGELKRGGDA